MRITSLTAACVVSIAMLAGCSSQSQATGALPGSASAAGAASAPGAASGQPMAQQFTPPQHKLSPMELLKLQAAGKIPGPSPVRVMRQILKRIDTNGRLHLKARPNSGSVGVWAAATYDDYIIGVKKNLTKTLAVIPAYYNDCYYPTQIKVDHSQNIWAGCQDNTSFSGGSVAEWNNAGSPVSSYNVSCPSNWGGCGYYFYGYDTYSSAVDASHVFASVGYAYGYNCSGYCYFTFTSGVEWWPAGQPSATPTFDALPYGSPVYDVYFMDEDNSGNLWLTFYGCYYSVYGFTCGDGLGKISNPTSPSWSFTTIENPGTYVCAGGVYVSNAGTVLNVTDPCTRYTYQYSLPLSTGGGATRTLGPTPTNAFGFGDPVSGGFNQSGTKLILGDGDGWLDRGDVSSNAWKAKANPSVVNPEGAAFTPSDK